MSSNHRRCIAHFSYRTASPGVASARANYLDRDGVGEAREQPDKRAINESVVRYLDEPKKTGQSNAFFDAKRARVGRDEVAADLCRGKRICSLIINPADSDPGRIDMRRLTRDTMRAVQQDLGTPIRWFAVVHSSRRFDRPAQHAHVVWSSQRIDDKRKDMRIAREYVKHGFQARASAAVETQLGRTTGPELARLREQMRINNASGRPQELAQLRREVAAALKEGRPAPIGKLRAKGREWVGLAKERAREQLSRLRRGGLPLRRSDYPASATKQPSAESQKWIIREWIIDNAPDVLRGQRRGLVEMVRNPLVTAEQMTERAKDFALAQGLRERIAYGTLRNKVRGFFGHKPHAIDSKHDRATRRIGPYKALALAERIRANPALLERPKGLKGAVKTLRRGDQWELTMKRLSPQQTRSLEAQIERKMGDLAERKILEAEHRATFYRTPAERQQQHSLQRSGGGHERVRAPVEREVERFFERSR